MKQNNLRVIDTFPSKSSSKVYTVKGDPATGELSCNCPGWIYKKGAVRTCPHVREVEVRNGQGWAVSAAAAAKAPDPGWLDPPQVQAEKGGSLVDIFARLEKENG